MTQAITYTIRLDEPALLAAPGGDPNTETSHKYVPGGALRGALVARYLDEEGASATEDDQFARLFLSGDVRYLNAYPALPERALPVSRAWATKKDEGDTVYDRTDPNQKAMVEAGLPKSVGSPFASRDCSSVSEIDFEIAIHTARNREYGRARENDDQSALFRYQALARDQVFAGVVLYDDLSTADADRLQRLLEDSEDIYLGGSRRAGYGSARLEGVTSVAAWREAPNGGIKAGDDRFVMYLTSDAILHDPETGRPSRDILTWLPKAVGKAEVTESFAGSVWVGGFNTHWGLPLPQQWAFQMGSTWVIEPEVPLSQNAVDALLDLERRGIGQRVVEGFGRFLLAPDWPSHPFELAKRSLAIINMPEVLRPVGDDEQKEADALLTRMNERLVRNELDRLLAVKVNELSQKQNVNGHLSPSQLARIQLRIRRETEADDFKGFIDYLDGTNKRKSADDQFRRYRVDGSNFRAWLLKIAADPSEVWDIVAKEAPVPLQFGTTPIDYRSDARLTHQYTVRFISSLCRQLAKLEVRQ